MGCNRIKEKKYRHHFFNEKTGTVCRSVGMLENKWTVSATVQRDWGKRFVAEMAKGGRREWDYHNK